MAPIVMTLLAPTPTGKPGAPPYLWEENPVAFVADFSERAGRCRQRIRAKREIVYGRCPRHLCCIMDEFACKAIVIIPNIDSLVHPMPRDGERRSRTRWLRIMVRALSPPGGVACLSQRSALARGFQGPLPACEPASEPMATALCMPINRCLS